MLRVGDINIYGVEELCYDGIFVDTLGLISTLWRHGLCEGSCQSAKGRGGAAPI